MNNSNTMQEAWESYKKMVIPPNAHPTQIKETRRAFYAGAAGQCEIFIQLSNGNHSTKVITAIVNGLREEIVGFSEQVIKGEA